MPMLVCMRWHVCDSQGTWQESSPSFHLLGLREQNRVLTVGTFTIWPILRALYSIFYAKEIQSAMKKLRCNHCLFR